MQGLGDGSTDDEGERDRGYGMKRGGIAHRTLLLLSVKVFGGISSQGSFQISQQKMMGDMT